MINLKEFYIIGKPIDTPVGKCSFLKVEDYPTYFQDLQIMSWSKRQIIYNYFQQSNKQEVAEIVEELKKHSFYQIVFTIPQLTQAYYNVFLKVFEDESVLEKISEEDFYYYRSMILTMNCQKEEKINKNPEIQAAIDRSKRVKAGEGEPLEFADIASSIVVASGGINYNDLANMTIYQFYMTYHRISQVKKYDTTTLFATVSEKAQIEDWSKHIDLFAEESHSISKDEMSNKTNSLFGNRPK